MWDRLPYKSYLYERDIINNVNDSYDICCQVLEDVNYVLIFCLYANACWNELAKLNNDIVVPNSLTDVFGKLSNNQVRTMNKSFIAITTWINWTTRNDRLFQ